MRGRYRQFIVSGSDCALSSDWGLVILESELFMTRTWNLFKAAHLVILLSAGGAHAKQPNVLFLAVDDMNDWIGSLGATPRAITPVSYTHLRAHET